MPKIPILKCPSLEYKNYFNDIEHKSKKHHLGNSMLALNELAFLLDINGNRYIQKHQTKLLELERTPNQIA